MLNAQFFTIVHILTLLNSPCAPSSENFPASFPFCRCALSLNWHRFGKNAAINSENHKLVTCELSSGVCFNFLLILYVLCSPPTTHEIVQHTIYCDFLTPWPCIYVAFLLFLIDVISIRYEKQFSKLWTPNCKLVFVCFNTF